LPQPLLVTDSHAFLELVAMLDGGERLLAIVVLLQNTPSILLLLLHLTF
jgi:hypothetical protein